MLGIFLARTTIKDPPVEAASAEMEQSAISGEEGLDRRAIADAGCGILCVRGDVVDKRVVTWSTTRLP